jgi:hypothetical protein
VLHEGVDIVGGSVLLINQILSDGDERKRYSRYRKKVQSMQAGK